MIQRLSIKNYAIIEQLEIDFSRGLTIITGETGAGKSILLGALGLIMGKRADTKTLYNEAQKCIIEGSFDVEAYDLQHFFAENDLDYESVLIVRREISPSGKSRAFVNDTPVNLKVLQQLSASLIDLHQQFDTLDLNEVSFQLKMLDALAGNKSLLQDYLREYRQYQAFLRKQKELEEQEARKSETFEVDQRRLLCPVCYVPGSLCCSQCRAVFYCCGEHQKSHWGDHKLFCKKIKKTKAKTRGTKQFVCIPNEDQKIQDDAAVVKKGSKILLHYQTMHMNTTNIASTCQSQGCDPIQVKVGVGRLLPGLDHALVGLPEGDQSCIILLPNSSYGGHPNEEWLRNAPVEPSYPILVSINIVRVF